ncbi:MAG TPA: tetratricopeptide repeat protein, partial [Candidatus Saccharimonadales bacterium]|nr:tetratricopeptide repeat protein [Candidatus Saccharimonadales bacterium]
DDLGGMYSSGNGVAEDDAQALVWFRKSAEAGNPTAMFNIGTTYESGQGTIKDQAEAIRWYRMAAKAGSAEAAKRLGSLTNIVNTTTLPQAH